MSGELYAKFTPRGQFIGNDPFNRWLKPSCVLMCEDNYSNAHGFPWTYKTLKIGKLIGAPVPGTMTAVWWETQIDPSIVFGIPQVGMQDMQGRYLENQQLEPDIEVYNSPESQLRGEDHQLEEAVKEMLKEVMCDLKAALIHCYGMGAVLFRTQFTYLSFTFCHTYKIQCLSKRKHYQFCLHPII